MTSARLPLALALLLSGCAAPAPAPAPAMPQASQPPMTDIAAGDPATASTCRGTTDSAVLSAERGIGGTGIARNFADQGIGGTGIGSGIGGTGIGSGIGGTGIGSGIGGTGIGSGIGGTGGPGILLRGRPAGLQASATAIVGAITGFAGLCVDGIAVAVDRPIHMLVDGAPRQSETLHLGQIAAIEARGPQDALSAVSVSVRHEVSGPVTAAPSGGTLEVAGQRVALNAQTRAPADIHAGDWVAVSGLRDLTGTIQASRIDPREAGDVLVSGRPRQVGDAWMLGQLTLRFAPGEAPADDGPKLLGGEFDHGTLRVDQVSDDPVLPAGGAARRIVMRSFASVDGGIVHLTSGLRAIIGPDFGARPPADRPVLMHLMLDDRQNLVALSWQELESP
jgi:hypothetical protein